MDDRVANLLEAAFENTLKRLRKIESQDLPALQNNLSPNGGFETWPLGTGPFTTTGDRITPTWTLIHPGFAAVSVSRTTDADDGSTYAARITYADAPGQYVRLQQRLDRTPGSLITRTLAVSTRVRFAGIARAYLSFDGGTTLVYGDPSYLNGTDYETLTLTEEVPSGATAIVYGVEVKEGTGFADVDNALAIESIGPVDFRVTRMYDAPLGEGYAELLEIPTPTSPSANHLFIYAKDLAGVSTPYWKGDDGVEYAFASGAGPSGFVPYTGATGDVDLGTHDLFVANIQGTDSVGFNILGKDNPAGAGSGVDVVAGSGTGGVGGFLTLAAGYAWTPGFSGGDVTIVAGNAATPALHGHIALHTGSAGMARIQTNLLTADRIVDFPNKAGTLAMLSDIPAGSPAALTRVDDTNVTLALGGTPATALLQAVSLTLGWTGQLSIARGGTGQATALAAFNALSPLTTRGDLLTRDATNNVRLAIGTTGKFLKTNGTDPSWQSIVVGDIGSGAALTKVDDTNVTLTLGGSPTTALLAASSITVGWAGTLAAARLNANVVQSVVNDTNVTGSIAAQALTLGWTGTLAIARGGTGQATALAAFNALSVLTTRGDLLTRDATNNVRLGIGTTGKFLKTDGTDPSWQSIVVGDIGSGAALTKTDDTNVTLTLGGSPTTALLAASSLTLGWTGTLAVARGGTASGTAAGARTNLGIGTGDSPTLTGLTLSGMTLGSVIFAGVGGVLSQNNANFFWDDSNNRLGIGITPLAPLHVFSTLTAALIQRDTSSTVVTSPITTLGLANNDTTTNNSTQLTFNSLDSAAALRTSATIKGINTARTAGTITGVLSFHTNNGTAATQTQIATMGASGFSLLTGNLNITGLTASRSVWTDSSKNLVSSPYAMPATVAQGDLLYGSSATQVSVLVKDANATRYLSNTGTTNNPAWAQVNLANGVTGILPIANGGSGASTAFTLGSVLFAGASGVFTEDNAGFFYDDTVNALRVATLIGGTGTGSSLALRATTGVGVAGSDIIFQVGNNGSVEAGRIYDTGRAVFNQGVVNAGSSFAGLSGVGYGTNDHGFGTYGEGMVTLSANSALFLAVGASFIGDMSPDAGFSSTASIGARGISVLGRASGEGTVTGIVGGLFQASNVGLGAVSTAYGINIQAPGNSGGGTISTAYGLFINSITVANGASIGIRVNQPGLPNGAINTSNLFCLYNPGGTATLGDTAGTTTNAVSFYIGSTTYTSTALTPFRTITNAASIYVNGAPVAGANVFITNGPYAIWSDSGNNRFDGDVMIGSHTSLVPIGNLSVGSTTGAIFTLNRNDPSVLANDTVGIIQWRAIDDFPSTQLIVANIEVQATNTIASDINPGRMIFRTTPITAAAAPLERFRLDEQGSAIFSYRVQDKQGADVASTNNLVLGGDGNVFEITGTTQVNLIANTNWQNGSMILLLFTGVVTVKNATATSGANITLLLAGAVDFVSAANNRLQLVLAEIGGTQAWREVSRSL